MQTISTKELEELLNSEDIKLLDVREDYEYNQGHIEQAKLFPLSNFPEATESLDLNKKYYLICRSGNRSKRAAEVMERNNFDVVNVEGGMLNWTGKIVK